LTIAGQNSINLGPPAADCGTLAQTGPAQKPCAAAGLSTTNNPTGKEQFMAQAKKGDRVQIHFTGTLKDGTVFDTTLAEAGDACGCDDCDCENGPMEMVIGEEDFFPVIEEALVGMAPGEKKTVVVAAADAFGEYDEENVYSVNRSELPADLAPEVGLELEVTDEDGESEVVTIIEVTDEDVTLDANHPLAGEDLTFEFELVAIL
jgi:peptidylprolyl isomerase